MTIATCVQPTNPGATAFTLDQLEQSLEYSWLPSEDQLGSVAGSYDVVAGSHSGCGMTCQANSWNTQCSCS